MAKKSKNKRTERGVLTTGEEDPFYGAIHAKWEFPEFHAYERGARWYVIAAILAAAALVYAVSVANYLFAVSIIIFIVIIFLHHKREPLPVEFKIMEDGISVDQKFHGYKQLKNFWIIYEPPAVKRLYITPKVFWRPEISLSLEDQNPVLIRQILLHYLEEDKEKKQESPTDTLSRIFKI